jgi:hypothetical protein
MNDTAPAGRCDLDRGTGPDSQYLELAAWYGGWSRHLVLSTGCPEG